MFERFTDKARRVMTLASQEAVRLNHEYIGTEHILLGLAGSISEGGRAGKIFTAHSITRELIRKKIAVFIKKGPDGIATVKKLPQTSRTKKVIEHAIEEARKMHETLGINWVGTEHLLLGLLLEHEAIVNETLQDLGLTVDEVRDEILELYAGEGKIRRKETFVGTFVGGGLQCLSIEGKLQFVAVMRLQKDTDGSTFFAPVILGESIDQLPRRKTKPIGGIVHRTNTTSHYYQLPLSK